MKIKCKLILSSFFMILMTLPFLSFITAGSSRSRLGNTPGEIVDSVAGIANEGVIKVQDTKLDSITRNPINGSASRQFQISSTLAWIVSSQNGITPYLQRTVYIGLIAATILLIWNGLMIVTQRQKITDAKEKVKSILLGVILMTGFVVIIKLVTALINLFFS